jgi:hypothetical protein
MSSAEIYKILGYAVFLLCLIDCALSVRNALRVSGLMRPLAFVEACGSFFLALVNFAVILKGATSAVDISMDLTLVYRIAFITLLLALVSRRQLDYRMWSRGCL